MELYQRLTGAPSDIAICLFLSRMRLRLIASPMRVPKLPGKPPFLLERPGRYQCNYERPTPGQPRQYPVPDPRLPRNSAPHSDRSDLTSGAPFKCSQLITTPRTHPRSRTPASARCSPARLQLQTIGGGGKLLRRVDLQTAQSDDFVSGPAGVSAFALAGGWFIYAPINAADPTRLACGIAQHSRLCILDLANSFSRGELMPQKNRSLPS